MRQNTRIEAVLFDAYGTVIQYQPDEELPNILARSAAKLDLPITAEKFQAALGPLEITMTRLTQKDDLLRQQADSHQEAYYLLWYQKLLELLGITQNLKSLAKRMADLYPADTGFALDPQAVPLLTELERRGIFLGLVSNSSAETLKTLDRLGLGQFDSIGISALLGVEKPHPKIYQMTLDIFKVPPQQALFVGDSLAADVWGPQNFGMIGVWLNRNGAPPDPLAYHQIRQLSEVLRIVDARN